MCSHATGGSGRHVDLAAIDRLAGEITELASHIHAATCRWLGLIAEFDRREGWAQWGCKSCAHFVSWRCSIAPVAAREHVRVARRLEELPRIRAAFAQGRLSYSKVRALSRVEEIAREEELLALAEHATAAQLERLIQAYRGVVATQRAAASGRPARYVTWDQADDGSLLLRARLPAEEGAIALAALEAGVDALGASAEAPGAVDGDSAGAASGWVRDDSAEAPADGSVEAPVDGSVEAPVDGSAEAPADDSAEAPSGRSDDDSAEAPAEVDGGKPPSSGVEDDAAEAPRTLVERRADALILMADTLLASEANARGGERYQVVLHVDEETLAGEGDGRCELAAGGPLAPETARRLACDAAIVALLERDGKPLSVGRKTRSIPPALRRALASRDRGCRFPGCGNRCAVDAHHVRHWAHGGPTSLDNLVQLCRFHHRLLHEGGYRVEPAGAGFLFRRPDGQPIRAVPRPPRGRARALRDGNRRQVDPEACVPGWTGERLDLAAGVDAMFLYAPLEAPGI